MNSDENQANLRSEQAFADLFGSASPRPAPPAADETQVRDAVHAEWQGLVQRRSRRRRFTAFALAASVLLTVFAGLGLMRDPTASFGAQQVATIGKQFGAVIIRTQGEVNRSTVASIQGNDIVETGTGAGIELGWHDGGSLRLDENTVVVFEAANQVYLQEGRIYFDSVDSPLSSRISHSGPVELLLRTDRGIVQHLGTQYMLEASAEGLSVSVREGEVSFDSLEGLVSAGQQMTVAAGGMVIVEKTDVFGEAWQWLEKTAPVVKLDGRPIAEVLAWAGRETGRSIEFATPAAETIASDFKLIGFDGETDINPARALNLFAEMADLQVEIDGGLVVVRERTVER